MKIRLAILALILLPLIAFAHEQTLPLSQDFDTLSPWHSTNSNYSIVTDASAPNSSSVLRFTYPTGFGDGNAPDLICTTFPATQELYYQYWFKYSPGWEQHPVEDKQIFIWANNVDKNLYVARGMFQDGIEINFQGGGGSGYTNTNSGPIAANTWYKLTGYVKINSGSNNDGLAKLWLNDILILNQTGIRMWYSGDKTDWFCFTPVWGGFQGETVNSTQYFYIDRVQLQTTPFGESGDQSPPYVDTFSPGDGATGVAQGTTSVSFHFKDSGTGAAGADSTSLAIACTSPSIATKNCGDANFACTGTSADYTATLSGLSLSYDQQFSCTINGADLATPPNTMGQYTYNFTVQANPNPALAVTTATLPNGTVGTAYSQTLVASGGTSPYTWSLQAGSLPAGLSLSSSGVISGVPTTAGLASFTVLATDSVAATDNQDLTITINPVTPSGQTTITISAITDTFINSGAASTNYGTETYTEVYQWPIGTAANRVLDNIALSSLPANITITAATLEMYLTGHEGSGGTNPMRVYVYRVTGTVPDPATVTWASFAGTLGAAESYTDVSLVPGWFSWNVLESVQGAYTAGTPLYLALDGKTDGAQDTNRIFASIDHGTTAWRPRLKVTYTQLSGPPPAPSIMSPGKMRITKFRGKFH